MNKKVTLLGESVRCSCGNYISVNSLVDSITDDLDVTFNDFDSGEEEFDCEKCGNKYNVSLTLSISVDIDDFTIEKIAVKEYVDVDGNTISSQQFHELILGEKALLFPDGEYEFEGKVYVIEKGVLTGRFASEPHPNQMSLL